MYKVLIVDDEILVRVGLKSTIDWYSIGFMIVAEASNGEQALEMFEKYKPDVVLTDIKMPKLDGLQLTEHIKKKNPVVKVLILTCYSEFSYVREALKLGASNYILKSEIEDAELINLMKNIHMELDKEVGKMERYSYLENQINLNINVLKEKLLNDLINPHILIDNDIISRCEELSIKVNQMEFLMAVLYKNELEKNSSFHDKDWQLINFAIINIATEILNENNFNYLLSTKENHFIILINKESIDVKNVGIILKRIMSSIAQYVNIHISIVAGKKFTDITYVSESYEQCINKLQLTFYDFKKDVFLSDDIAFKEINIGDFKEKYTKLLINSLYEENSEKSVELVEALERAFIEMLVYPAQVKFYYTILIADILEYYNFCFLDNKELNEFSNYYDIILNAQNISNITKFIKEFISKALISIKHYRKNNSYNVINKATEYIKKNYSNEITLQSLANHLNLSKHYVCYLFKKETGENISAYINKVRIENVKQLLGQKDYKVKDIYDKVGFSDEQYFCKMFKKVTGMTVAGYKSSLMKRE
jgi:Response regulator containing CheY-like receiver domain and AraC-type DNA-binding domain